jgi:hypothetical protein
MDNLFKIEMGLNQIKNEVKTGLTEFLTWRHMETIVLVLFLVLITGIILSTCFEEKDGKKVFNNAKASKILIGISVPLIVLKIAYSIYFCKNN